MSIDSLLVSGLERRALLQPQLCNTGLKLSALNTGIKDFRRNRAHLTLLGRVFCSHVGERVVGLFSPRYSSMFAGSYPDR